MIINVKNDENMGELVRILVCEGYCVDVCKRPNKNFPTSGIPYFELSVMENEEVKDGEA